MPMIRVATNVEKWIEFVGGPFDGHWHSYVSAVNRLPAEVLWLVSNDTFRELDRTGRRIASLGGALSSAAFYELDATATLPKYRHAGSISAQSFDSTVDKLK